MRVPLSLWLPGVSAAAFADAPRLAYALRCALAREAGERVVIEALFDNDAGARVALPAEEAATGNCGGVRARALGQPGPAAQRPRRAQPGVGNNAATLGATFSLAALIPPSGASQQALDAAAARAETARGALIAGTRTVPCKPSGSGGDASTPCGLSALHLCPAIAAAAAAGGVGGGACALGAALSLAVSPAAVPALPPPPPPPSSATLSVDGIVGVGSAAGALAAALAAWAYHRRRRAATLPRLGAAVSRQGGTKVDTGLAVWASPLRASPTPAGVATAGEAPAPAPAPVPDPEPIPGAPAPAPAPLPAPAPASAPAAPHNPTPAPAAPWDPPHFNAYAPAYTTFNPLPGAASASSTTPAPASAPALEAFSMANPLLLQARAQFGGGGGGGGGAPLPRYAQALVDGGFSRAVRAAPVVGRTAAFSPTGPQGALAAALERTLLGHGLLLQGGNVPTPGNGGNAIGNGRSPAPRTPARLPPTSSFSADPRSGLRG